MTAAGSVDGAFPVVARHRCRGGRTSRWARGGAGIGRGTGGTKRGGLLAVAVLAVLLTGCQTGIGSDQERPRATIRAFETRVGELEREVGQQQATLESLTPPPPTTGPPPFAELWRVVVEEGVGFRDEVGVRDGLTPIAARGAFLIVPVTTTNLSDRPAAFTPTQSLLVADDDGRIFDVDPTATGAAFLLDLGYAPSFGPRQPRIAYPDVLVFDVDPDSTGFTLESLDESFIVELPVES